MVNNDKFYKLKNDIEKGKIRYIIKTVAMFLTPVIFGKFIGAYIFGDEGFLNELSIIINELSIIIIPALFFVTCFSLISWNFKVSKYKKESQRRNM